MCLTDILLASRDPLHPSASRKRSNRPRLNRREAALKLIVAGFSREREAEFFENSALLHARGPLRILRVATIAHATQDPFAVQLASMDRASRTSCGVAQPAAMGFIHNGFAMIKCSI